MSDPESPSPAGLNPAEIRQAILSGDPSRAMPALVSLRQLEAEQAVPLLLLGLEQEPFIVRSLSCAGLGVKRNEAGWEALAAALKGDGDANVRAEAANALVSYGVERAWPLLRQSFESDDQWLVRCSILSALAEDPAMPASWLLDLANQAIADGDGTVRVGGAEILGRLVREATVTGAETLQPPEVRASLVALQADPDHRVAAAALNGLQW
ncbi:HEAT repeat domain-containing protein [Synechococcus sp. 1G10]|uniref:HEAT repeat domain-containing protein n=1 Tax=Synechococcus sp. 1G10 TaxID=2025605 RepID=UPI000B99357B|nr:HEAT repeat domain-containing protein [Synechococcus sp. 1G10]